MSMVFVRALRSGARPLLGLGPSRARLLCAAAKPPPSSGKGEERVEDSIATTASTQERAPGGLAVYNEDEENLPPLKFEPGVVGAAQKGVSAVVIAFGACAFGACFWGVSQALFPSATSTQVVFSEALDKVSLDATVGYALGTPLKAWGADRGGDRGRRNAMERWETEEDGQPVVTIRFHVAGPQGTGVVVAQVPRKRKRGEFRYILFEHRRKLVSVLDNRTDAAALPAPSPGPAPSAAPSA